MKNKLLTILLSGIMAGMVSIGVGCISQPETNCGAAYIDVNKEDANEEDEAPISGSKMTNSQRVKVTHRNGSTNTTDITDDYYRDSVGVYYKEQGWGGAIKFVPYESLEMIEEYEH